MFVDMQEGEAWHRHHMPISVSPFLSTIIDRNAAPWVFGLLLVRPFLLRKSTSSPTSSFAFCTTDFRLPFYVFTLQVPSLESPLTAPPVSYTVRRQQSPPNSPTVYTLDTSKKLPTSQAANAGAVSITKI